MILISLITTLLLFFTIPCFASTKYVDVATGSDADNGTTEALAWATIQYAMQQAEAGDTVLVKGGIYREHIKIYTGDGGSSGNPVTIKNFDSNEVILDGSLVCGSWSVHSGNIYKCTMSAKVDAVVVDEVPLKPAVTQTNINASYTDTTTIATVTVTEGKFYQDNSTDILYVWVPGGGSPATHTLGIVRVTPDTSNQYDGIYLWDAGYFTFENLTIRFYGARGIEATGASTGSTYKNLKIKFNRHTGISAGPYANVLDSEIAWNFLWNWPRGKFNGGTQGGGWGAGGGVGQNSLVQGCTIYKNGGEGFLTYMNPGNSTFRNNTVYDNWSMNLYIDTAPYVVAENNLVYCTQPDMSDDDNNAFSSDGTVYKGMLPIGIGTADEYYGGAHDYYAHDITIRNNIVIGCRRGYNHFAQYSGSGMINIEILNNTIITPDYDVTAYATVSLGDGDNFTGINIANYWEANTGNIIKNNIVVARNSRNYALYAQTGGTYDGTPPADPFAPYDFSNNLWYNTASSTPIHWGVDFNTSYDRTLAQWVSLTGTAHGANDLSTNPLFAGTGSANAAPHYVPQSSSPALAAGVTISGYTTDYSGVTRPSPWAMGALEYAAGTPAGRRYRYLSISDN